MSSKQIELYKYYLDKYRQTELFANYHMLQMIWTHPKLLAIYSKQVEKKVNLLFIIYTYYLFIIFIYIIL